MLYEEIIVCSVKGSQQTIMLQTSLSTNQQMYQANLIRTRYDVTDSSLN